MTNSSLFDAGAVRIAAAAILRITRPDPDAARHTHQLLEALGLVCRLPGCDRPARSLGFCDPHYRSHRIINYTARKKSA